MEEGPDVPKGNRDEVVLRILRRAADEREAARDELRLAEECDGPLEPFWRRAAETHERSAAIRAHRPALGAVAHEGAAAAHERAAKLHESFALVWDERHREAMEARERSLAEAQRTLAAASRRRADHERESPVA
jgi:hypothetical protein